MTKRRRLLFNSFLFILLTGNNVVFAQAADATQENAVSSSPAMATGFYADGKIWVVIGVIAIILTGLILYLVRLEGKMRKMEKQIHTHQ